jgi:mono/diheme cytochrome c family protein
MIRVRKLLVCTFAICLTQVALAQSDVERGRAEFLSSCAVCHGAEATGDGPLRPFLVKAPPDLTMLARRNGGEFPARRVMDMIDGRAAVQIGSHGTREMPVWGKVYAEGAGADDGRAKLHPEWTVRERITRLTQYLARLQVP